MNAVGGMDLEFPSHTVHRFGIGIEPIVHESLGSVSCSLDACSCSFELRVAG